MLVTRGMAMILVVVLAVAACGSSSPTSVANSCGNSGANANVNTTSSNSFSPSAVTITHGQTVCWQAGNVTHTVTSDNGLFNATLDTGQVFMYTFATAGAYPYHCTIHSGMTGTVTVN
jgi:plastocyanin